MADPQPGNRDRALIRAVRAINGPPSLRTLTRRRWQRKRRVIRPGRSGG